MKQSGTPPTGSWAGATTAGVKSPAHILLPDPTLRFARTAERLEHLADTHAAEGWLAFMAEAARAQAAAVDATSAPEPPDAETIAQSVAARIPPVAADGFRRAPVWRDMLGAVLAGPDPTTLPAAAATVIADVRALPPARIEALADSFLRGGVDPADSGAVFWIAAGLQVYFTRLAALLPVASLRLLEQRDLCPCCGSTASASLVAASGQNPGIRYLFCSLCSTAWNHTRAVCITCGGSRKLSLRGVEGDPGVARAETCDECGTYSKIFYEAKDTGVDPYADDFATLGLDMLVGEAGWSRHAPNPLLLVG
jgi:FdhE protein